MMAGARTVGYGYDPVAIDPAAKDDRSIAPAAKDDRSIAPAPIAYTLTADGRVVSKTHPIRPASCSTIRSSPMPGAHDCIRLDSTGEYVRT